MKRRNLWVNISVGLILCAGTSMPVLGADQQAAAKAAYNAIPIQAVGPTPTSMVISSRAFRNSVTSCKRFGACEKFDIGSKAE